MTAPDAPIITDLNRATVYNLVALRVGVLMDLSQPVDERLPTGIRDTMQAMIEATLGEHGVPIAVLFEKVARALLIAIEEPSRDQGAGHNVGGAHLGLGIVLKSGEGKKIGTKAVNCDNLCAWRSSW